MSPIEWLFVAFGVLCVIAALSNEVSRDVLVGLGGLALMIAVLAVGLTVVLAVVAWALNYLGIADIRPWLDPVRGLFE